MEQRNRLVTLVVIGDAPVIKALIRKATRLYPM
jgi:hypothetical protein